MSVQLIHGDCLEEMPKLAAGCVKMVFADLPFGVLKGMQWDIALPLPLLWQQLNRLSGQCTKKLFTANFKFASILLESNQADFCYDLVVENKLCSNPYLAKKRPLAVHDYLLVFGKLGQVYNPQMRDASLRAGTGANIIKGKPCYDKFYKSNTRVTARMCGALYPRTVLANMSEPKRHWLHPTQKPVALLEWLIKTYSNPGDTVLDPTAGSGTTAIAALRTGRKAICIEKDKGYYDIMCKRVADEQAQQRLAV